MSRLVLVGAPASGKSTVGRLVAEGVGAPFIDVDEWIEQSTGMTISEIFIDKGEAWFRDVEREATCSLIREDAVVSLGGGAILDPRTRQALTAPEQMVCWLQVSVTHATRRVGMNVMRPLLLGDVRANLQRLLSEREPFYREVADIALDTSDAKPPELAAQLLAQLKPDHGAPA